MKASAEVTSQNLGFVANAVLVSRNQETVSKIHTSF